jgi:ribosomal protein S18 acetylase RimI-like enzyme
VSSEVRLYRPEDRAAVREIAWRTGFIGESPEWYWRDRHSFEEIWTPYYTDQEPESLLVATRDEQVVGYLTGCVDTTHAPSPKQAVLQQLLRRALLFRPGTAAFFRRAIADSLRHPNLPDGEIDDPRWPAHLHTNLLPEGRGCGLGRALMQRWLQRLRAQRVPGCHLGTLAENERGVAFFTRMGFRPYGDPVLAPGMRMPDGAPLHMQLMVIDLHPKGDQALSIE